MDLKITKRRLYKYKTITIGTQTIDSDCYFLIYTASKVYFISKNKNAATNLFEFFMKNVLDSEWNEDNIGSQNIMLFEQFKKNFLP